MDRPIRTGALFGLGFALAFTAVSVALEYTLLSTVERLYPEPSFGEPEVVRAEVVVRDGVYVVLATVKNATDTEISFDAEASIYDSNERFVDTCETRRLFELGPTKDLNFIATCSVGPEELDVSLGAISRATVSFY